MRIGEVSRQADVTARTIRYYESIGLLPPGERRGSGQHSYSEATVTRLRKIDQLKALGLSLDEIASVIDLYFADPSGREAKIKVLAILRQHLADVERKIGDMAAFRRELETHIARFEHWLDEHGSRSEGHECNDRD